MSTEKRPFPVKETEEQKRRREEEEREQPTKLLPESDGENPRPDQPLSKMNDNPADTD